MPARPRARAEGSPRALPPSTPRRLRALIVTALSCALVVTGLLTPRSASAVGPASASPTTATSPKTSASPGLLTLTSITPTVAGPTDTPVVTGRIHNAGASALPPATLTVRQGTVRQNDADAVLAWASSTDPAAGQLLASTPLAGIPAGGDLDFTVTLPAAQDLTRAAYDVVPISLDYGSEILHTFVGVQRSREYQPLSLAWLAPLTIDPEPELFGPAGPERVKAWQGVLGPQGRIARLTAALSPLTPTYAVDAALLAPETSVANGNGSTNPSEAPTASPTPSTALNPPSNPAASTAPSPADGIPGPGATTAEPDLTDLTPAQAEAAVRQAGAARLAATLSGATAWILPPGDPDIAAGTSPVSATGQQQQRTALASVRGRSDIAWPVDPRWSTEAQERYAKALGQAPAAVVVTRRSLTWSVAEGNAGRRTEGGQPLLAASDRLSGAAAQALTNDSAGAGRQLFLALSMAQLRESPGVARSVLVALPRDVDADRAAATALLRLLQATPWLTTTSASAILDEALTAPAVSAVAPQPVEGVTASPLNPTNLKQLTDLRARADGAAAIRTDSAAIARSWGKRFDALESARWRGHQAEFDSVLNSVRRELDASAAAVRVAPQTINFLADSGRLQVTVLNGLDVPVSGVRVRLVPDNPRLRIERATREVSIGANSRTTVTYDATALASGPVQIEAQVTGPTGASVGPATVMLVRVSPTGNWIYWLLGALAVLALLAGIWRGRRSRARADALTALPPNAVALDESGQVVEQPYGDDAADVVTEVPTAVATQAATAAAPHLQTEAQAEAQAEADPAPAPSAPTTVARSGAIMAAGTMTSRALGLIRVALLATIIGTTGLAADAFTVANTLPNQFYLLLAGGILNAVLVPQIVKASTHGDGGEEFVNRLITLAVAMLVVATTLTTLAGPLLVRAFFDTTDSGAIALSTLFAFICLPQMFFYGLYTVLGQVLNAKGRFGAYMWAPVAANIVALAGLVVFLVSGFPLRGGPESFTAPMILVLGGSATLSIAVQALCLLIPLRRMGFRYRPVWGFRGVGLRSTSRVAGWTFAAVAISQLGFFVTSRVLSGATDAAVKLGLQVPGITAYGNAFLFFMLPHSLVTVSLVTALFTRMANAATNHDHAGLRADVAQGLRMPAVVLVPGVAFVMAFGPVLTRAFFAGNTVESANAVAVVVIALSVGVIPYGWLYLSERFFYAHEDARIPFFAQMVVTSMSVIAALLGARLGPELAAITVGLGQSLAYVVGAAICFTLIRRRIGALGLGSVTTAYLKLGMAAAISVGVIWWGVQVYAPDLLFRGPLACAVVVLVTGPLQLVLTWTLAHLLGVPEIKAMLGPVRRRLQRV